MGMKVTPRIKKPATTSRRGGKAPKKSSGKQENRKIRTKK